MLRKQRKKNKKRSLKKWAKLTVYCRTRKKNHVTTEEAIWMSSKPVLIVSNNLIKHFKYYKSMTNRTIIIDIYF